MKSRSPAGQSHHELPLVPDTTADEHDWMICSKLEEFVHIGWATKWIHKLSVFLVSAGQQSLPRALDQGKLAKERKA